MSKINVLSFEIANLIAAGEVVERPSSVLKELIENSIDAGATKIVAEIKKGGVSLIRVTDNGIGMDKEDLPISLKRHATSKIKDKDDLLGIMTLGFRGEALAAISSVCELTIISRTKDSELATMLTAEAGKIIDMSEVGAAVGTTVVVENLFCNVPARRKFLKKDSTEAMNVTALVEKVALSRPDISIQLLIDGEEKFKTPGDSSLINTIKAVFGREFASKMIETKGVANGIEVTGYVGRSDNVRKNRNLQNVFINGRYVKSLTAMAAIEKAYTSYIAPECFPTCVLFINMPPSLVDVNVHPAKLEVKFSDERVVFETVYYTVKSALSDYEYRPEMSLQRTTKEYNPASAFVAKDAPSLTQISLADSVKASTFVRANTSEFTRKNESYQITGEKPKSSSFDFGKTSCGDISFNYDRKEPTTKREDYSVSLRSPKPALKSESVPTRTDTPQREMTPKDSIELLERYTKAQPLQNIVENTKKAEESSYKEDIIKPNYKLVGEAFDCYVLVEYEGDLLIIDKHAAHERIIFEQLLLSERENGRVATQELLLPLSVTLSPTELSVAEDEKETLRAVGFSYFINGKNADITAIPSGIGVDEAEGLFVRMLDEITDGMGKPEITDSIRREKALYQVACKAAIKGGRVYDENIVKWLVEKVLMIPDITVCPHGRPIAYKLTKRELDKNFDRIK